MLLPFKTSLQFFTPAMTAHLSWYVQNFEVITTSQFGLGKIDIITELELCETSWVNEQMG